jgi:FAD/FMN-containing dehydrogenase
MPPDTAEEMPTPQGQRHSAFRRSQVPGGIVADVPALRSIGAVEGDRVVVEAGATWSDVLRATLAQGKTPPVPTGYLDLSVGGTRAHAATTTTYILRSVRRLSLAPA